MSSSSSTSSPSRAVAASTYSDDDSDDSVVRRNIRRLPLPSSPSVLVGETRSGFPGSLRTSATSPFQPPAALFTPQPVHAAQASLEVVPTIPLPNPPALVSGAAAAAAPVADTHVAHIPRPLSLHVGSSSSCSGTVPMLTTATVPDGVPTASNQLQGRGAAAVATPSLPTATAAAHATTHLAVPSPSSASSYPSPSALQLPASSSPKGSSVLPKPHGDGGTPSPAAPTASLVTATQLPTLLPVAEEGRNTTPQLHLPPVAPTVPLTPPPPPPPTITATRLEKDQRGFASVTAGVPYAVTALLPVAGARQEASAHNAASLFPQSSPPPLVPPPPALLFVTPGDSVGARPAAGSLPVATSSAPATGGTQPAAPAAVVPEPAPNMTRNEERRRHLRRTRDALEELECTLFTSPDGNGDASLAGTSSDVDADHYAYMGRTSRFVPAAPAMKARPLEAADTRHPPHREKRKRKSRSKQMVIKMRDVEGTGGGSVTSREKNSQSSQSTNALTPDHAAQRQRHRPPVSPLQSVSGDREGGATPDTHDGADERADGIPLPFVSPAARFAALCAASSKNKGLSRKNAQRLTQNSLLGYGSVVRTDEYTFGVGGGANVSDDDEDDDVVGDESNHARAGTVHFRFTGAFSDATSDSKVLPSTAVSHEAGVGAQQQQHPRGRTGRGSGSAGETTAADGVVLAVSIRGMSPLHADTGVVHPFVRVWVVSCVTGQSLVQESAAVPCAVTHPFDMRAHKSRAPWWDAKVALRLSSERLRGAASDAMLLVEVLDFGNETIHGFPLLRSGLYPICWGFMMLRDCTGRSALASAENVHVQMYRYPQRMPWYLTWLKALLPSSWSAAGARLQTSDLSNVLGSRPRVSSGPDITTDVPSIYHVFKFHFNRKIPYEGGMVLTLRQHSDTSYVPDTTDMLPYEEYLLSMLVSGGGSCAVPRSTHAAAADREVEGSDDRVPLRGRLTTSAVPASPWAPANENYYRMDGERSLLPHDVVQTSAVMGVVTCVCFTHNGTLFALGVYRHLQYIVELRNPLLPNMPVAATLLGHTGHFHRIVFQKEDRYMLSCSSDGTVRVWQPTHPNSPFSADACVGPSSVQCVCTLPHGFPVYAAIFHQEKIIAGGFSDQLFVWGYERPLEGELPSMATAADDSALHLTATFTPQLQISQNDDTAARSTRVLLGELIHRVDNAGVLTEGGEPTITLSLASNERSNRAWSVHANGAVVCWRAIGESSDRGGRASAAAQNWQMSVRHTADCDGASEVQVCGSYAIVVCGQAPLIFVFDATTCEQLRVVSTRLPPATPVSLLPDGEAFVGAVGDPSRLVAWECFDGGLCTPSTGYGQAAPLYSVARMSWAESQQLSVMVSRSPCTEEDMVRFLRGPSAPLPGQSPAAYYCAKQEEQYRLQNIPSEMTLLTVAGTVRKRSTVIQTMDHRASETFCAMFGGDLKAKRKAEYIAQRTQASKQRETERDSRRARLHQEVLMGDLTSPFAIAAQSVPYDATEKGARMNAIINFWRGLVGQHKHGAEDLQRVDANAAVSESSVEPPPPATHRILQYLDEDGDAA